MKYDLAIIGGGINGAGIARDASLRGLKVILLEKDDFASGASSKSTKLAHGGLRYLQQFDFKLVQCCLKERDLLLSNLPQFVKPQPFIFPVYRDGAKPLWMVKLGLYIYDYLTREGTLPKHTNLTPQQIIEKCPGLRKEGLKGGCLYYDGLMEDALIVIQNVLDAEKHGATILNYHEVTRLKRTNGRVTGLYYRENGAEKEVEADVVINATGAWSRDLFKAEDIKTPFKIAPTKGVHLIIPQVISEYALTLTAHDGRVFFLIPWHDCTLLGTTDTFYDGDPNKVTVEKEDVDYLLKAFSLYFPDIKPEIISSFAGLRPLVSLNSHNPSDILRDHLVDQSVPGMLSFLGGKYTSYRETAAEVVDQAAKMLGREIPCCQTAHRPIDSEKAKIIAEMIAKDPSQGERICEHHPHTFAEVTYAIDYEKAKTLEDWLYRRTSIGYTACGGKKCSPLVAKRFTNESNG